MSDLVKELMPYLQKLADKLDSSAQVLWILQIQQARVALVWDAIACIGCLTTICLYYKFTIKYTGENDRDNNGKDLTKSLLGGLATIIAVIELFCRVGEIVQIAFNPEYWALHEIIKMVK